ncbi:hypothetical protein [Paraburkholderia dioscoreae]|uniref:Uncharacterized protein n=1 Tax=Paraburkholderia dioscoreae TaxID=2604047 RepID=A0A5Q4Z214_9BURK|nr:hypothetical protein [Paraburkholderia dioscoreae]VVD28456.1 conserved protein of unknown function [Paraburkholderia dioscoreae]
MSIRTLIEVNHDLLHRLQDSPEIIAEILARLGGSYYNGALNEANEAGRSLDIWNGVRIVHQYHHSTRLTVKTDYAKIKL